MRDDVFRATQHKLPYPTDLLFKVENKEVFINDGDGKWIKLDRDGYLKTKDSFPRFLGYMSIPKWDAFKPFPTRWKVDLQNVKKWLEGQSNVFIAKTLFLGYQKWFAGHLTVDGEKKRALKRRFHTEYVVWDEKDNFKTFHKGEFKAVPFPLYSDLILRDDSEPFFFVKETDDGKLQYVNAKGKKKIINPAEKTNSFFSKFKTDAKSDDIFMKQLLEAEDPMMLDLLSTYAHKSKKSVVHDHFNFFVNGVDKPEKTIRLFSEKTVGKDLFRVAPLNLYGTYFVVEHSLPGSKLRDNWRDLTAHDESGRYLARLIGLSEKPPYHVLEHSGVDLLTFQRSGETLNSTVSFFGKVKKCLDWMHDLGTRKYNKPFLHTRISMSSIAIDVFQNPRLMDYLHDKPNQYSTFYNPLLGYLNDDGTTKLSKSSDFHSLALVLLCFVEGVDSYNTFLSSGKKFRFNKDEMDLFLEYSESWDAFEPSLMQGLWTKGLLDKELKEVHKFRFSLRDLEDNEWLKTTQSNMAIFNFVKGSETSAKLGEFGEIELQRQNPKPQLIKKKYDYSSDDEIHFSNGSWKKKFRIEAIVRYENEDVARELLESDMSEQIQTFLRRTTSPSWKFWKSFQYWNERVRNNIKKEKWMDFLKSKLLPGHGKKNDGIEYTAELQYPELQFLARKKIPPPPFIITDIVHVQDGEGVKAVVEQGMPRLLTSKPSILPSLINNVVLEIWNAVSSETGTKLLELQSTYSIEVNVETLNTINISIEVEDGTLKTIKDNQGNEFAMIWPDGKRVPFDEFSELCKKKSYTNRDQYLSLVSLVEEPYEEPGP